MHSIENIVVNNVIATIEGVLFAFLKNLIWILGIQKITQALSVMIKSIIGKLN